MNVIEACDRASSGSGEPGGSGGSAWASAFVVVFVVFLVVDLLFSATALFRIVRSDAVKSI